jgi:hypothetical protein
MAGATGLLHCPQFISFSGPQSAVAAVRSEAQASSAAEFHNVAFHPSAAGPRPVLLKASMPVIQPAGPDTLTKQKQHHHTSAQRVKKTTNGAHQALMLTNWPEQDRPRIILTVTDQHQFFAPYAAMHTDSGWLVIQL